VNRFQRKKSFLFDLDGTLVDSSRLHERALREALQDYAPQILGRFDYESLKGKSTAEALVHLGVPPGALDSLVHEKQQRYRAAVRAGELRLTPGSRDVLELLEARRDRMFVVTGGSRRSVAAALESTGIHGFFEGVVSAEDVPCGKPAPDGFLFCMKRFRIPAPEALGIEDSANGLEACQEAGLDAVLVNNARLAKEYQPAFASLIEFREALIAQAEAVLG